MSWLGALAGPWGWLVSAFQGVASFCIKHWKLTLAVIALAAAAYGGMKHERSTWEKKWVARNAKDQLDEEQRIRTNLDLDVAYQHVDAKASLEKAAREKKYQELEEKVNAYAQRNRGGSCGIGDDGLQLVRDAIRARHLPNPRDGSAAR